jgi:NADH-quinone oxidoreductase subunit J
MDMISFKGIVFIASALIAIAASVLMATRRNPIHSALWMIVTFFAMAVIYLLLNAQFIAVAQVMVYAGAIMMLILFVIMLVHMEKGEESGPGKTRRSKTTKIVGALITVILFGEMLLGVLFYRMTGQNGEYPAALVNGVGNVKTVGVLLYGQYLFPFEIASILLLVGIVGAVVIAKRK